jgi:integrase
VIVKLSKRTVESVKPQPSSDVFVWDEGLPGFGLRVSPSGARGFLVQYRHRGRTRRMALGRHGRITVDQARKLALEAFGQVAAGRDPSQERREARKRGVTVAQLADRFLEEHARPKKKPSSVVSDEGNLDRHIRPALGRLAVADVTRADVARLHHQMRKTPGAANHVLACLSKMMNLAEKWGLRPDGSNPCRHVERYPGRKMERFLSPQELGKLGDTLRELEGSEPAPALAAVRLLILTGCRRSEILDLQWRDVDLERRALRLRDSKTGPKTIPLNAPAAMVLEGLERTCAWVIPNAEGTGPISLSKPWERIRTTAGLPGLRVHDLRHSFASVGAGSGISLYMIGKLLGHTQAVTTQRYAHLADDPLREASEAIAARVAAAMNAAPAAEVVPIQGGTDGRA